MRINTRSHGIVFVKFDGTFCRLKDGGLFAMIRRSDAMCIYLLIVSTQFDPDATISDHNPLVLVFHRRRVDERILLCEAPWCVG